MTKSTHRVEVFEIQDLQPHPNADRLELTTVWGYTCIVPKDKYKVGDLAAYIPPDSVVPETEEFSFLWTGKDSPTEKDRRIRAVRLRGILSAGLVIDAPEGSSAGDDVAEHIGVTHYEPPPQNLGTGSQWVKGPPIPLVNTAYDLENGFRYYDVIPEGTFVHITEKLHGCLLGHALVTKPDGTTKHIKDIEVGETVLGVDSEGKITESAVTHKFQNGKGKQWLKITGPRIGAGRGNSYFSITCTPEHRFYDYITDQYVEAKDLIVGQELTTHRTEYKMTPVQKSVILGKLLGDGSLQMHNRNSAMVTFGHTQRDEKYVQWTIDALGDIGSTHCETVSGYGSTMVRGRTTCCPEIKKQFGSMIIDGNKIIPEWVAVELDPIAIAFWYMDDGSLAHHEGQEDRAYFATNGYNRTSCEVLVRGLAKFGIQAKIFEAQGYRLRLDADDAERLFLLVAPYIPFCMQRKLPSRYRGHSGWIPTKKQGQYKPALCQQIIESIETIEMPRGSQRHDIETETHNYFAHGILVHNSNGRWVHWEDQTYAGSRNHWGKYNPDGPDIWWRGLGKYPGLVRYLEENPGHIVYGEVYGMVQKLRYGHTQENPVSVAVFDIFTGNEFLRPAALDAVCTEHNIPLVPSLGIHPFTLEEAKEKSTGESLIADHEREGCVVVPLQEAYDPVVGRVKLKFVSDEHLLKGE
jgi:hypothetical protein